MDYYDPDTTDLRIKTLLEKAQEKDNASKVLQGAVIRYTEGV